MTAILSHGLPSMLQPGAFDPANDTSSDTWCSPYMSHLSITTAHWADSCVAPMPGMPDADPRMFQLEPRDYEESFHGSTGSYLSPETTYLPEPSWGSDADMPTPPTSVFSNDHLDAYPHFRTSGVTSHHLSLPGGCDIKSFMAHSPQSSAASPMQQYAKPSDFESKPQRPSITRSVTAPDEIQRRKQMSPVIKRPSSADGCDDDDYAPAEDAKRRGRKRQRIPHTAVERRYRENLNAHLDRLRQNVPALNSKRAGGSVKPGEGLAEGVKPSKCEILNGAIEHIGALGKENVSLKSENKTLLARLDELERWYGSVQR